MSITLSYLRKFPFSFGKGQLAKKVKFPDENMIYTNRLGAQFDLHFDQYLMRNIYLYDIPEANTFNQIERLLKSVSNPVIIDCGANVGLYSINLAKYFPKASIHAFEPLAFNYEILNRNIRLNGFKSIRSNKNGVGDKKGTFEIKFGNKKSGASIYVDEYNTAGTEEIEIVTIDDYCFDQKISSINLMKIDVEGGELKVLKGAFETLKKSPDCTVVVEVIEKHLQAAGDSAEELFSFMHNLGFKAYLPKSWPFSLRKVASWSELPAGYSDNIFFRKLK
jgi:FkbM family methyltransferase